MLMHPRMERLQAYGAGELTGEPKRATAEHIAQCPRCRSTLVWMDDMREAARQPAPEPPADAWSRIAARVERRDAVLLPVEATPSAAPRGVSTRALRVAVVFLMIAGAAAAVPREWLRVAIDAVLPAQWRNDGAGAPATDETEARAAIPPVTLLVEPAGGAIRVALNRPHEGVRIHVRLVEGNELEVRATDGAAAATFRTSPGRVDIVDADSGAVVLLVPRSLGNVRIEVEGRTFLLKERGQIRILAPMADTVGAEYILPVRGAGQSPDRQ